MREWMRKAIEVPAERVAAALGLSRRGISFADVCPKCGSTRRAGDDRRKPLALTRGGRRFVHFDSDCGLAGDGLDLAFWVLLGHGQDASGADEKDAIQAWFASLGVCEPPDEALVRRLRPAKRVSMEPEPEMPYPDPIELARMWCAASSFDPLDGFRISGCTDEHDGFGYGDSARVASYFAHRSIDLPYLVECGVAGVLPASYAWPKWWPWGRRKLWRAVVLAFDSNGVPRSIHARAVNDDHDGRKTRWPYKRNASRLFFADPLAWRMLRGDHVAARAVIVAEGITDFLAAVQSAFVERSGVAVFGATSGTFEAFSEVKIPLGVPVVEVLDDDKHGRFYARKLAEALPNHHILRGAL